VVFLQTAGLFLVHRIIGRTRSCVVK